MSEKKHERTEEPRCTHCKGDNVKVDAFGEWDVNTQQYELVSTYDQWYCDDCEGECRVEWVPCQMLTEPEALAYVRSGDGACPYCGSGHVEGGSFACEDGTVWQKVSCTECDREWQDVYYKAQIDQMDADGNWQGSNIDWEVKPCA